MSVACLLLAVLSIWDYPARFPEHSRLSRQFVVAVREGDTATMEETCRKGVALLPDDPTWHYNLACSLAYFNKREDEAFDELEKAIDLGFRDVDAIARDTDLRRISDHRRYRELLEYADQMKTHPLLVGPMATVDATGVFGKSIALGEQNLGWDFTLGCFVARMRMVVGSSEPSVGDLYMNRDRQHSALKLADFPGVTAVYLDKEGRSRNMDRAIPNILFPYPAFGNASVAYTQGTFWRSLPRAMMTTEVTQLPKMLKLYLSNQTWVFPSNMDTAPVGTNGDVFASLTPYWITTAGRSYSDMPYLRAALEASRSFRRDVKDALVGRQLLTPTVLTLIRKSLKGVADEDAYLTPAAHPTAFPRGGVELARLKAAAQAMTVESVPPLTTVSVTPAPVEYKGPWPERTYATSFAWAFVLRADANERTFVITAQGASDYAFVQTHGNDADVKIERLGPNVAKVTLDRRGLSPTNRVDITVVGRNAKTGWGAPSYVSFARMDPSAPYSDPALTQLPEPLAK